MRNTTILVAASLLLLSTVLPAQPNLTIKRVVNNWPAIELYYTVACSGAPVFNLGPSDFRVFDDGAEVAQFTMHCPDPSTPCAMSVGLVFDASGSMAGTGNAGAIQAGKDFVAAMDGTTDQAAVLWFNHLVTLRQPMTTNKYQLGAVIDSLPAVGGTAVWDGIMAGLQETAANGTNSCRALIALTDGSDNSSTVLVSQLIAFANLHHIRVFTIGLGSGINGVELQQISQLTGGRYFQTALASELTTIYSEILTIIRQGFLECSIVYDAGCPDGSFRNVELQVVNVCGGSDTKSKTYRAPRDTTAFASLPLRIDDGVAAPGADVEIPLLLDTVLTGEKIGPLTLTIIYNRNLLTFTTASTTAGSLLDGMAISVTPVANGVRLQTQDARRITGSGELLRLGFLVNSAIVDTVETDIVATYAWFSSGCWNPIVENGTVRVTPGAPLLTCLMDAPPVITWDTLNASYAPSPFVARLTVHNAGNTAATGDSCEIMFDAATLRLVSPATVVVPCPDIPVGESRDIVWQLDALPRVTADSTVITMTARFTNHADVVCTARVHIGKSEPVLSCEVDIPALRGDTVTMRYEPNPIPVTVTVRNVGVVPADNIEVFIEYPSGMLLAGGDIAGPWVKSPNPASLQPGQHGTVAWQVSHPLVRTLHSYTLRFHIRADRGGTRHCEGVLEVPPINGPILTSRCSVPDSLSYDEAIGGYQPNPFAVRVSAANNGTDTAYAVSARLLLPNGLELDPPTQPIERQMHSAPMGPWNIGDPVPEVSWTVRWTKLESTETYPQIRFLVSGLTRYGDTLVPVQSICSVRIRGLRRELYCNLEMVDSLRRDASGRKLEPNPVTLSYFLRNTGQLDIRLARVYLSLPADGVSLNPGSPQVLNSVIDTLLRPGDSLRFVWTVDVEARSYARTALFAATVIDAEGDPRICDRRLYIPATVSDIECALDIPPLRADYTLQRYEPMPLNIRVAAVSGKAVLSDSIFARIEFPTGGFTLAGVDSGRDTKLLMPARLFPQQAGGVEWLVEHPIERSAVYRTVRVFVWEKGGETSICEADVPIPAIPAPFWFDLAASGPLSFCDGGEVTLDAGAGFASYLWSTQDTTRTIVVRRSGSYWCGVMAPDGVPGLSNSVTVTVHPLPPTPVITRAGDVLAAPAAAAWQWYRNGTPLPNANTQTHTAVETGEYTVRITDGNGCEALSDPLNVSVLRLDAAHAIGQRFQLYPNPAGGTVNIDIVLERPAPVSITLHDMLGRELRRIERSEIRLSFTERFDLRGLLSGVYVLRLTSGSQLETRMLVVN